MSFQIQKWAKSISSRGRFFLRQSQQIISSLRHELVVLWKIQDRSSHQQIMEVHHWIRAIIGRLSISQKFKTSCKFNLIFVDVHNLANPFLISCHSGLASIIRILFCNQVMTVKASKVTTTVLLSIQESNRRCAETNLAPWRRTITMSHIRWSYLASTKVKRATMPYTQLRIACSKTVVFLRHANSVWLIRTRWTSMKVAHRELALLTAIWKEWRLSVALESSSMQLLSLLRSSLKCHRWHNCRQGQPVRSTSTRWCQGWIHASKTRT